MVGSMGTWTLALHAAFVMRRLPVLLIFQESGVYGVRELFMSFFSFNSSCVVNAWMPWEPTAISAVMLPTLSLPPLCSLRMSLLTLVLIPPHHPRVLLLQPSLPRIPLFFTPLATMDVPPSLPPCHSLILIRTSSAVSRVPTRPMEMTFLLARLHHPTSPSTAYATSPTVFCHFQWRRSWPSWKNLPKNLRRRDWTRQRLFRGRPYWRI